ncbi:MAG: AAA family ATPase [Candidatus Lindowbacteria bacterium]|nr:AAA family ATPase [Candidatus Lindowbacteria bacterium]
MEKFSNILGQTDAVSFLQGIIKSEKYSNAMIFVGPPGVGKGKAAEAFAFAASCINGTGCARCAACKANAYGEGFEEIDIVRLAEEEKNQVKGLRRILGSHSTARQVPRFVVCIKNTDRMNESMQAAMLKSIEEPPPKVTYVLISSNTYNLASTIRSRSVMVRFRPLPHEKIVRILEKEGLCRGGKMTKKQQEIVSFAEGSVSRASQLLEQFDDPAKMEKDFFQLAYQRGKNVRNIVQQQLELLVPVMAKKHPEWSKPLVDLDSAINSNANISLAFGSFKQAIQL